jgi:hypothetical protein
LIAAAHLAAQDETGTFSATSWARASYGWDFDADSHLGKPDGDWDATGAGTTLSYQKGEWTTAGEASVTTEDFGATYGASGSIKMTWAQGDWTVYGKLGTNFNPGATDSDNTLELSVENWKQDANDWGIKGLAKFGTTPGNVLTSIVDPFRYLDSSDDNKVALFVNLWDKRILLETGFGDYADAAWQTPGPLEVQYETKDDEDSAFRLQFKPFTGLNAGFAWLPAVFVDTAVYPNAGLSANLTNLNPVDTLRAITYGAKYSVDPLTAALGFNFEEDKERGYLGASYKLGDLTFKADTELIFPDAARNWNLGEAVVYAASPLEIGLTLKENSLIHGDAAAEAMNLFVGPYIQYDLIEKVARAKLGLDFTKGLGEDVKDEYSWALTATFGWSLNESVALDPDDIGTGFVVKYIYGYKDTPIISDDLTAADTTTNKLYFGFKASF